MQYQRFYTPIIIILMISSIFTIDLARRYTAGDFQTDTIELEVLYSSEKAGWLESVVEQFENEFNDENTGPQLDVVMTPIGTGKGTIQIANGASQPTIWSPASRFWLPILNFHWQKNNDQPIVQTDEVSSPSMVISPTIIAVWKNYQQENNIEGLQDLHDLAEEDNEFTFAHTDPYSSNSGFGGVIMEASVAAGLNPEELTVSDLSRTEVQTWMRTLESSAIQYGSSTGFLAKLMVNEGPNSLKAAFLYENLVVEKNKELQRKIDEGSIPEDQTLVAVYPEDGTVLNDHPFAILDAPWVSERDRELGEQFTQFLLRPSIQEKAIELGFRPSIDLESDKIGETFSPSVGVKENLTDITIYSIANIKGEVLERIPDLWSATRSRSLDENEETGLTINDFVVPAILLSVFLIMVLTPTIKRIREEYL